MAALAGADAKPTGVSADAEDDDGALATDAADGSEGSDAGVDGNAAALAGKRVAVAAAESGVCLLQATSEAKAARAIARIKFVFMRSLIDTCVPLMRRVASRSLPPDRLRPPPGVRKARPLR